MGLLQHKMQRDEIKRVGGGEREGRRMLGLGDIREMERW